MKNPLTPTERAFTLFERVDSNSHNFVKQEGARSASMK